jgi:hypothetical protein
MICPLCNKKTNTLLSHMQDHGFTSIESAYAEIYFNGVFPTCICGNCNKKTTFVSWRKGFRQYIRGHNRSNYGNKQSAPRVDNTNKRKVGGWSKGKTVKDSSSLERASLNLRRTLHFKKTRMRLQRIRDISSSQAKEKVELCAPNFRVIENLNNSQDLLHLTLECKICGHQQQKNILHALNNICNKCDPTGAKSHIELYRTVRGLDPDTVISCDSIIPPDDIDIYMPMTMTAIEYHGLYFNSELFKNRLYHAEKTRGCNSLGIKLLHLFEDEWREKRVACLNHIKMLANKGRLSKEFQIYCRVLDKHQKSEFLELNHLEGDTNTLHDIGLFIDDDIVAIASLRKPRHRSYIDMIELCRFCNISEIQSSTVLAYFVDYIRDKICSNTICAVVDDRLGLRSVYEEAGFLKDHILEPRFWWTDGHQRLPRHKINHSDQHDLENALVKIWGCDVSVLIKKALN